MLHTFFQTCWTTGNIPKDWKKATEVAIPKNGKPPQQTSSYRPIALTPHLGKVYERVLKNRLDHHLEKNEILPLCQAGFRKGRNCMEHDVRLIEDTKKWSLKGKNKKTVATFFDIKKAFDSVWHAKLLNKMGALGITGRMYNFIQTFLDSREITVKTSIAKDRPQQHVDLRAVEDKANKHRACLCSPRAAFHIHLGLRSLHRQSNSRPTDTQQTD
ncbi:hypothetical protein ACOMHN_053286 [Nucella lapillus]